MKSLAFIMVENFQISSHTSDR